MLEMDPLEAELLQTMHILEKQRLVLAALNNSVTSLLPPSRHLADMRVALEMTPLSTAWTIEEQRALEREIEKGPEGPHELFSNPMRLIQIAATLPDKSVRDVAIRVRKMCNLLSKKSGQDVQQTNDVITYNKRRRFSQDSELDITNAMRAMGNEMVSNVNSSVGSRQMLQGLIVLQVASVRSNNVADMLAENDTILAALKSNTLVGNFADSSSLMARFASNMTALGAALDSDDLLSRLPSLPALNLSLFPQKQKQNAT